MKLKGDHESLDAMNRCRLLQLCQELRDLIYEYAFLEDLEPNNDNDDASKSHPTLRSPLNANDSEEDQYGWLYSYPSPSGPPAWQTLMACNRQLRSEIQDFLSRLHHTTTSPSTAHMTVHLDQPLCTAKITPFPTLHLGRREPHTLHLTLHLHSLYHSSLLAPSHAIPHALWRLYQHYTTRGPRLKRPHPLSQPLRVETLRIQLATPSDDEVSGAMAYGNPWMQLHSNYSRFKWTLCVFARAREEAAMPRWDGEGMEGLRRVETRFRGRWEGVFASKRGKVEQEGGEDVMAEEGESGDGTVRQDKKVVRLMR